MRRLSMTVLAFSLILAAPSVWCELPEESTAKSAEQAGRLREALSQYVVALQKTGEGSADEQRLREAVLRVAQKVTPTPSIPEEARRAAVRAHTAIKAAASVADFEEAAKEFGKAVRIAPWWADAYYNQALALEKAGRVNEAIRSFKLYVLAAPNAPEARKVQDQIYALEYQKEKSEKEAVAKRDEQERKRREDEAKAKDPARIAGDWCYLSYGSNECSVKISVNGTAVNIVGFNLFGTRLSIAGKIEGENIVSSYRQNGGSCGWITPSMGIYGKIVAADRIEIAYDYASKVNNCVALETKSVSYVLFR